MAALLAVVALGLMAYIPGRFLLRLLLPAGTRSAGGRLFLELLLGNISVGLVAFLLAELGIFSLAAVLCLLAVISIAAGWLRRGTTAAYGLADLAGVGLVLAGLAWVMPPFDTSLYGHDSSVYLSAGLSLARHGSIPFPDPTLEELSLAQRQELFPSYGRQPGEPPFVRVAGGLLLSSLDQPVILPAFHHLLSVWVALAYDIGGDAALAAPAAYFAALSLWALVSFTFELAGGTAAAFACLLLLLSPSQYWYSRFLMPEIPSQYFLWGGLLAAAASFGAGTGLLGLLAGLGMGMSGLMRIDGMGHIAAALALWMIFAPHGSWPAGRGFLPAFGTVALWALAHQVLFPTHYSVEARDMFHLATQRLRYWWSASGLGAAVLPMPFATLATRSPRRARGALLAIGLRLAGLGVFLAYLGGTLLSTPPNPAAALGWLVLYAGWPALVAGGLGLFVWARRATLPAQRFALVLALSVAVQLFVDARVTPAPLWAMRRFVPIVLPALLIAAALLLDQVGRRWRWLGGIGLVLLLAGTQGRNALTYRDDLFQDAITRVRALAAQVPEGAVLVYDPAFARDTQMHIALWAVADAPAYLLAAGMREPLLALRAALPDRAIYWIGAPNDADEVSLAPIADPVASYRFAMRTRRLNWYEDRDDVAIRDVVLRLYRLRPAADLGALH